MSWPFTIEMAAVDQLVRFKSENDFWTYCKDNENRIEVVCKFYPDGSGEVFALIRKPYNNCRFLNEVTRMAANKGML